MRNYSSPIKLVTDSFDVFFEKNNFITLLKIYAWIIPFQLFFLYQNYYVSTQSQILNISDTGMILSKSPVFFGITIAVNIIFFIVTLLVEVAGIKALLQIVGGKTVSIKQAFSYAAKKFLWFFLLQALVILAVVLGLAFLIIPGIVIAIWFSFSKFVFIDKNMSVVASIKKSKELVKGKFWKVTGRLLVFAIFGLLVQSFFALIPYGIGTLLAPLFGALITLPYVLFYKEISG